MYISCTSIKYIYSVLLSGLRSTVNKTPRRFVRGLARRCTRSDKIGPAVGSLCMAWYMDCSHAYSSVYSAEPVAEPRTTRDSRCERDECRLPDSPTPPVRSTVARRSKAPSMPSLRDPQHTRPRASAGSNSSRTSLASSHSQPSRSRCSLPHPTAAKRDGEGRSTWRAAPPVAASGMPPSSCRGGRRADRVATGLPLASMRTRTRRPRRQPHAHPRYLDPATPSPLTSRL